MRINVYEIAIPNLSEGGIACEAPGIELGITGVVSAQWNPSNGVLNPTALSTFANPTDSTFYTANYIDLNGCNGISSPILVVPGTSAQSGFTWNQISNFEVVFEANSTVNQNSTWLVNDTILVGDSVVYNFPYEYLWDVVQIVENSCGTDTFSLTIEVIKQVGFEDIMQTAFSIYPNPSENQIAIRLANGISSFYSLEVFNAAGQLIKSFSKIADDVIVLDVSSWCKGVYEFVFHDSKQIQHLRFIR